jgi:hypothetical protein
MSSVEKPGGLRAARGWFVGLALVCASGAGASLYLQQRAVEQQRSHARERAVAYASQVVAPPLADRSISGAIDGQASNEVASALKKEVFSSDPTVMLVRLWASDGRLMFSSNPKELPGPSQAGDVASIRAASKHGGKVTSAMSAGVLSVYAPLHVGGQVVGAVEVDRDEATVERSIEVPWILGRTVAAGAAGFFVVLTLLSFVRFGRRRSKRLAGKAFTNGSADPVSGKGLGAEGQADGRLQSKLAKAEEARKALEAELSQLRTQVATANEAAQRRVAQLEKALEIAGAQAKDEQGYPATAGLEAKVKDLESALAVAKSRAAEVEARSGDMAARYGENQTIAERSQTEAEAARAELASVQARASDAATALEELERRVADGEAAKTDLKQQIAKLQEELRWAQAQTTETQPILQEATAKAQEEKSRAEELLDRATRAEARFHDAEARAAQAESRSVMAETRAAEALSRADEAEKRAAEAEGRVVEFEARAAAVDAGSHALRDHALPQEAPTTSSDSELVSQVAALQAKLEHTEVRAKRAYAEAEAARAELTIASHRGEVPPETGDAVSLQIEVDRLGTELARTLERAHAAEERGARLEAELVALHSGMPLGNGPADPIPEGWAAIGPRRNGNREREENREHVSASSIEAEATQDPRTEDDLFDPRPAEIANESAELPEPVEQPEPTDEPEPEGPSLRSRLARTAAQKKGQSRSIDEAAQRH